MPLVKYGEDHHSQGDKGHRPALGASRTTLSLHRRPCTYSGGIEDRPMVKITVPVTRRETGADPLDQHPKTMATIPPTILAPSMWAGRIHADGLGAWGCRRS